MRCGGDQRLGDHQPAKNSLPAHLRAAAAKQVLLDLLQIEDVEKIGDGFRHAGLNLVRNMKPPRHLPQSANLVQH